MKTLIPALLILAAAVLMASASAQVAAAPIPQPDTDGDGCIDLNESWTHEGSQVQGGRRDPNNPWDYFNPTHDQMNRVDDILEVVEQFMIDLGEPGYREDTDRTFLGPNGWNLGPPDGLQRVDDIVHIIHQFGHDCFDMTM